MRLPLNRPPNYDKVLAAIDSDEWDVGNMLFHIVSCIDVVLKDMDAEVRHDLLVLLGSRYNLHLATDDVVKALEYERDALRHDREQLRLRVGIWRSRALALQEELANVGDTRKRQVN